MRRSRPNSPSSWVEEASCLVRLRYDKYENKTLYWYEEDLEFEWEKTATRASREEAEFERDVSGMDMMLENTEAMDVDMRMAAQGCALLHFLCIIFLCIKVT